MYLKEGIMLQIIREFCYKMANKKFKSNLMDGAIESDRLSNLYGFDFMTIITMVYCSPFYKTIKKLKESVKKTTDKALKSFVKNGGVILHIDDEHLRRKVNYCKKTQTKYIITHDIKECEYNTLDNLQHINNHISKFTKKKFYKKLEQRRNAKEKKDRIKFYKWLSNIDVKFEKYKKFFPFDTELYLDIITNIDTLIRMYREEFDIQFIYINDPDVYTKVKTCKHRYCLTDNINEVKLNYLIPVKIYEDLRDQFSWDQCPIRRPNYINNTLDSYKRFMDKGGGILDVNSPTLEEDINYCRDNNIKYLISVQYDLIKEFLWHRIY